MIKMSEGITEAQQRELEQTAIDHADSVAGDDDVAFVRELRSKFFAEQSKLTRNQLRTSARRHRLADDISLQIYRDPRFARNARELARLSRRGVLWIIGGGPVMGSNFQDVVAVGDDGGWFCSGTLIAENAVLTAGHCICDGLTVTRVFFGDDVECEGKVVPVGREVRHPNYHSDRRKGEKNDLMVLILASAIRDVQPRRIASSEIIDMATNARVVGFGDTDPEGSFGYGIKRQTDVPIVSHSCQGYMDRKDDETAYGCDPNLELVAGKPLLAMNTCSGDSGGPLYVSDGQGGWLLAGATSRATHQRIHDCGDGGIYARVDRYLDWIRSIVDVKLH